MAVNRFDKPVESEYVSQYTPIPFEQLYAIGKANNEAVQKAYDDLNTAFTKWAEFQSPSAVDTKRWYDLTIGAGMDFVDKLAANPDLIKTAAGRAEMQQFINSRPYAELSALKQSREGLLARQKANQQLMANGKYNPAWHDVDFANYDTSANGIYNDISPLAYKSVRELVEPYVDNLKPQYITTQGIWDYSGITPERTDAQVANNWTDIYNTPELQKHIEVLRNAGMSDEQAQKAIAAQVYQAGRERAYYDREMNPLSKIELGARATAKAGKDADTPYAPIRTTKMIQDQGMVRYRNSMLNIYQNDPVVISKINKAKSDLDAAKQKNDQVAISKAQQEYDKIVGDYHNEAVNTPAGDIFARIIKSQGGSAKGGLTWNEVENAGNTILNNFSTRADNNLADLILSQVVSGSTISNTALGKRAVIPSTEGLIPYNDYVLSIANTNRFGNRFSYKLQSSSNKVAEAIRDNKFSGLVAYGGTNYITVPTSRGGETVMTVDLAIPVDLAESLQITSDDMRKYGARVVYGNKKNIGSETITVKSDDGNSSTSESTKKEDEVPYYSIKFVVPVPGPEDGLSAQTLDQNAWGLGMTDSKRSDLYTRTQAQALGLK